MEHVQSTAGTVTEKTNKIILGARLKNIKIFPPEMGVFSFQKK